MKFLKLFSIVALSAVSMTMFAAINAQANIAVRGNISGYGDEIDLYQDDASSQLVTDIPATQPSSINMYVVINSTNYSSVKQASLEGLQIVFKANTKETGYTLKFNNVSGEEYFLQVGDDTDPANFIPMTEDYPFTCEKSAEITFTVVKKAAAAYTRDVTAGQWGTICYPEAITSVEGAVVYELAGRNADATQIAAVEVAVADMVMGKPYLFNATADVQKFFYNAESSVNDPVDGANGLTGVFEDATLGTDGFYVIKGQSFIPALGSSAVLANRAYLAMTDIATGMTEYIPQVAGVSARFFSVGRGAVTGLDGAAINGLQNGKFIMNGRFMIVKDGKTTNVLGL